MRLVTRVFVFASTLGCLALGATTESAAGLKVRAYGAWVNVPEYGAANRHVCDSGWLPAVGGGHQTAVANGYVAGTALMMDQGTATAISDDDCEGDDDFARVVLGPTILMPGYASEITFSALDSRDDDECCNPDDDDFHPATIADLTFGGEPVIVTGAANQEIVVEGVGRLVVNEIVRNLDDDCDDDDFTTNALHLYLQNGSEIIVGSTTYDDDDDCCAVHTVRRSWGTLKSIYR